VSDLLIRRFAEFPIDVFDLDIGDIYTLIKSELKCSPTAMPIASNPHVVSDLEDPIESTHGILKTIHFTVGPSEKSRRF
jgi:hypothetical protein